ncbi:UNVERIFIED_CONTAM: hypothetical protein FKN15_038772 [Acipenser sinensis]
MTAVFVVFVYVQDALINQCKFEEQDIKDVFITVDCPENHVTSIETFVTYRVITKTTRSEFDSSEYEVRRRYQDFLWLKGKLEEAHPTLIINELASHKKQGPGLLSRMGETVRAVAASVRGVQNRPEEFTAMNDYVETFSQKMGMLDKIAQRIVKEQKAPVSTDIAEYLEGMKECGPVYTLWSGSEDQLVEPLKAIAGCIDNCCKVTEEHVAGLSENQVPILHEYVLCAETLKAVLRRRDNIQAEYESKVDALASKKADKENLKHTDLSFVFGGFLGKKTEEAKQQKEQRLDCEMKELKEEIGRLEDKVECANNTLKVDWERWKRNMQSDVKSAFVDMADTNMNYYKKGETCADSSDVFLFAAGRGRQPIDIRLSVMAVTRRGLPIESITGAEALVESCGDGEPQKKKRATEQSISSSRGETLGSPVYER